MMCLVYIFEILLDGANKKATGVKLIARNDDFLTKTVKAASEIIISAGAINSPKLLMLSGIGPKLHVADKKV